MSGAKIYRACSTTRYEYHNTHSTGSDIARPWSRSYLQAIHVGTKPTDHWGEGGWYDCTYKRTPEGWKFHRVKLTAVWLTGDPSDFNL